MGYFRKILKRTAAYAPAGIFNPLEFWITKILPWFFFSFLVSYNNVLLYPFTTVWAYWSQIRHNFDLKDLNGITKQHTFLSDLTFVPLYLFSIKNKTAKESTYWYTWKGLSLEIKSLPYCTSYKVQKYRVVQKELRTFVGLVRPNKFLSDPKNTFIR